MAFSDFVEQSLIAQPQWLAELESAPPEAQEWHHYAEWLQVRLAEVNDEAALMRELRQFRRRIMVRIAWAQALSLVSEESAAAAKRAGGDLNRRRARLAIRRLLP